jgi:hypothetical protein
MTAIYYHRLGRFTAGRSEIRPPREDEVRLDVAYCGLCGTDPHIAHGSIDHRVRPPQVIGHEMSGPIAEAGAGVTGLTPGDQVVVRPWTAAARQLPTKASAPVGISACSIPSTRPPSANDRCTTGPRRRTLGGPARSCLVLNSADLAHNPEVAGSNPAPATRKSRSGA